MRPYVACDLKKKIIILRSSQKKIEYSRGQYFDSIKIYNLKNKGENLLKKMHSICPQLLLVAFYFHKKKNFRDYKCGK